MTPAQAIPKRLLRDKPARPDVEQFKQGIVRLLTQSNESEGEEFHKNLVSDFLKRSFYHPQHLINTKGRNDLVIHHGEHTVSPIGVIIESKSPTNRSEMPRKNDLNVKAFHELLLYYLRNRFGAAHNISIRHLIITNAYEWYVFDATTFEHHFGNDSTLVQRFTDFEAGRLPSSTTEFFYREIAAPAIAAISGEIPFAHFDLRDYRAAAEGTLPSEERAVVDLFKLLSPANLLKLPYVNDNNTLDRLFYTELLHLLGLHERHDGTRRLIGRHPEGNRQAGSLIENIITQIESIGTIHRLPESDRFGTRHEDQAFNIALELAITWINRLLFLKLLEGQIETFHRANGYDKFLNTAEVPDFGAVNSLFFQILARKPEDRPHDASPVLARVPYLNSSLFEPTELEQQTITIAALERKAMAISPSTILRNANGSKRRGQIDFLQYLFDFLDAYDFGSEPGGDVQELARPLINASVLGLIFEKINGYRDGSYFTPGFITMYCCREVIRSTVISRFNRVKGWQCSTIDDLYDKIDSRQEANDIINSIRICDPAVGSGHFLVSALNEIVTLKGELRVLSDRTGARLKEYHVGVNDDELTITNEDGSLFRYTPGHPESQRVQEALFHEKQTIIENCLFGVDINPISANICRLRLWIELLKHAYYKMDGLLETLPNIDINIKVGNSLIARFALDAPIDATLNRKRRQIRDYREAVRSYQNAKSRDEKRRMEQFIAELKGDFRTDIFDNDQQIKRLLDLRAKLSILESQQPLFDESEKERLRRTDRIATLRVDIERLTAEVDKIRHNRLFANAFEWRFEFPEVLGDDGSFVGFDALIGNPPYGVSIAGIEREYLVRELGKVPDFEISHWFLSLASRLISSNGALGFILPNSLLFNVNAAKFRLGLLETWRANEVLDCSGFQIFPDAVVRNVVLIFARGTTQQLGYRPTAGASSFKELTARPRAFITRTTVEAGNKNWGLLFKLEENVMNIVRRLSAFPKLEEHFAASQGYIPYRLSDLIKSYGIDEAEAIKSERRWHASTKVDEHYIEELHGRSLSKYDYTPTGQFVNYGPHVACYVDLKFFNQRRLLIREITNPTIIATLVDELYINDPQIISVIPRTGEYPLEALWGIMNSSVATFYHFNGSPKATKGLFPKILVGDVKSFPLPYTASEALWSKVAELSRRVLSLKATDKACDVKDIERELGYAVYALYGFTAAEVSVVGSGVQIRDAA